MTSQLSLTLVPAEAQIHIELFRKRFLREPLGIRHLILGKYASLPILWRQKR